MDCEIPVLRAALPLGKVMRMISNMITRTLSSCSTKTKKGFRHSRSPSSKNCTVVTYKAYIKNLDANNPIQIGKLKIRAKIMPLRD